MAINKPLDITDEQREIIQLLIKKYLPDTLVWAFGSRVQYKAKKESDLDLAAFIKPEQNSDFFELKDAFEESDLPFRVDLLDWNKIPENFKENIEAEYMVIQDNK